MTRAVVVPCLLLGAVAACAGDAPATDRVASAIKGGRPAAAGELPSVVGLLLRDGGSLCTGTLVAPDLVLTAAHCLDPAELGYASQQEVTDTTVVVLDDLDVLNGGGTRIHPRATEYISSFGAIHDPDLGLVWLPAPLTGHALSPVNLDPARAPVGIALTQVGYGLDEDRNPGVLKVLEGEVTASCAAWGYDDGVFLCDDESDGTGICMGDSGGPSFATIDGVPTVVGVTSFVGDASCTTYAAQMRTDAGRAFFADRAPAVICGGNGVCEPSCGQDGLPVDPDCPTCADDGQCADGEVCGDGGHCVPGPFSPGGLGAECGDGLAACVVGACASGPDGQRCSTTCDPSAASACPDGFACLGAGAAGGACWPAQGGGCSAGGRADGALVLAGLAGLALAARRRR